MIVSYLMVDPELQAILTPCDIGLTLQRYHCSEEFNNHVEKRDRQSRDIIIYPSPARPTINPVSSARRETGM